VTQAPLPTWAQLGRALWQRPVSDDQSTAPWRRSGEIAGWLSRSAWSLALIALWRRARVDGPPITVWLPDFFCNAALEALRRADVRLLFYPVTDNLTPNLPACRALAAATPPDLFVLVHYFGEPSPAAPVRDFCARYRAWLVEDAAHVLRPVTGVGSYGDFVLYSIHKHLPVSDGAILVARPSGPGELGESGLAALGPPESWAGQLADLSRASGTQNSASGRARVWLAKRTLQTLGVGASGVSSAPFVDPIPAPPAPPLGDPSPSRLSRRLLGGVLGDLAQIATTRHRHQLLWDEVCAADGGGGAGPVSAVARPVHREWTPYLAGYAAGESAAAIYEGWLSRALPVTTWPDLPPEVAATPELHPVAWRHRHSRVYLPVQQSLRTRAIASRAVVGRDTDPPVPVRTVWDAVTEAEWNRLLLASERSNLLQGWAYGNARAQISGWRVRRAVFYVDERPVAFTQVLQKRIGGLLTVSRINRGPLQIGPASAVERRAVLGEVASLGRAISGRALAIAPELPLSGESLLLMARLGFRERPIPGAASIWIDLADDGEVLRKRLDSKWRNMLTVAEKSGLQLEVGSSGALFDWMLARYETLLHEKDFRGPAPALLRAWRGTAAHEFVVLRAIREGEPIAGICVALHAASATYLLGWNGDLGRQFKANQFLLWNAVGHLKAAGLRWLDLGGISEDDTPGIAAFKLGMNGERYELAGEFVRW